MKIIGIQTYCKFSGVRNFSNNKKMLKTNQISLILKTLFDKRLMPTRLSFNRFMKDPIII